MFSRKLPRNAPTEKNLFLACRRLPYLRKTDSVPANPASPPTGEVIPPGVSDRTAND